jgi:hypothetical protein
MSINPITSELTVLGAVQSGLTPLSIAVSGVTQ